jgi:hypothetical protein
MKAGGGAGCRQRSTLPPAAPLPSF